ncbi:hypothetical protein [Longimicrobium sp.]|uniref:hypothetical protein n=1 Tax=Longimicrobium sp. TaxID=2029185 RepID=UPI002ED7FFF0
MVKLPERQASAARYSKPRAIVASAERVDLDTAWQERSRASYAAWQSEAWTGYERVGEIHYGFNLVSSVLSRLRVFPAALVDTEEAPMGAQDAAEKGLVSTDLAQDAEEIMREISGPAFAGLVRSFGLNMNVPGECYLIRLVGEDKDKRKTVQWKIVSTDELVVDATGAVLRPIRGETTQQKVLPKNTYIGRIWRSHPRYSGEPDSSMIGVADAVEELLILQRLVRSATRTRLNNGLLFLPDGLLTTRMAMALNGLNEDGSPIPEDQLAEMTNDPGNQLVADILQAIVTAVSDEGDASAVAPIMVTGEGGLAEQIKHITFERGSDEWLVSRTERALERILQGIDVPKEVVTGLANVKYSNALVIDENLYKANIEPLALVLSDALTEVFLRPMLRAKGYSESDLNRIVVWYDPSEIVTRPNQAQDSSDGYDRFVLGPGAWRREHGFSDQDAPSEAEMGMMLLTSGAALPPEVQMALLQAMLPKLLGEQREKNLAEQPVQQPDSARNILSPAPESVNVSDAATGVNAA